MPIPKVYTVCDSIYTTLSSNIVIAMERERRLLGERVGEGHDCKVLA